jgi:hypothetical protein
MTIESAGKKYWKAHYEQARILEAEGIDLDVDGYPLASEGWIHDHLDADSFDKWVNLERIKDSIMRKIMKEIS